MNCINTMLHKKKQDRKKRLKFNLRAQFCLLSSLLGRLGIFPGYSRRTAKTIHSWQAEFYFRKIGWGSLCCKLRPDRLNHLLKLILSLLQSASISSFWMNPNMNWRKSPCTKYLQKQGYRFKVSVPALPNKLGKKYVRIYHPQQSC